MPKEKDLLVIKKKQKEESEESLKNKKLHTFSSFNIIHEYVRTGSYVHGLSNIKIRPTLDAYRY
jgi:hypothetical protein